MYVGIQQFLTRAFVCSTDAGLQETLLIVHTFDSSIICLELWGYIMIRLSYIGKY